MGFVWLCGLSCVTDSDIGSENDQDSPMDLDNESQSESGGEDGTAEDKNGNGNRNDTVTLFVQVAFQRVLTIRTASPTTWSKR